MSTPTAATVVRLAMPDVEAHLWDVRSWSTFIQDLESVQRATHERYAFEIRQGRNTYDVLVAVRFHASDHRFTWKAVSGPAWDGEIQLVAASGRCTRVTLTVAIASRALGAHVAEMFGGRGHDVEGDLERLQHRLATVPVPARPALAQVGRLLRVPARAAIPTRSRLPLG